MEYTLYWIMIAISLGLIYWFIKKSHPQGWVLVFFISGYFTHFLSVIIVKKYHLLEYPVRILPVFKGNLIFDYLLFPVINALFYIKTYNLKLRGILLHATLYSSILTAIEYWTEKNTQIIKYYTWKIEYSFIGFILFFVIIRLTMSLIKPYIKQI